MVIFSLLDLILYVIMICVKVLMFDDFKLWVLFECI